MGPHSEPNNGPMYLYILGTVGRRQFHVVDIIQVSSQENDRKTERQKDRKTEEKEKRKRGCSGIADYTIAIERLPS